MNKTLSGVIFAVMTNLIWGFSFIVSMIVPELTAAEIALSRYIVYGALSLILFFARPRDRAYTRSRALWLKALFTALTGCALSYLFAVLAVQLTGAAVTLTILATLPITCSLYGNLKYKEYPFRLLIAPIVSILSGVVLVNFAVIRGMSAQDWHIGGVLCAFAALIIYTQYYIYNAGVMKKHRAMKPSLWTDMVGIANLAVLPLVAVMIPLIMPGALSMDRFFVSGAVTLKLWMTGLTLGIVVSYIALIFWNKASRQLPTVVIGQLIVLETVFGLVYAYIIRGVLPSMAEAAGIVLVIAGVTLGIVATTRYKQSHPKTGQESR